MQSNNKQIGTLAGDHNKPAGPAIKRPLQVMDPTSSGSARAKTNKGERT